MLRFLLESVQLRKNLKFAFPIIIIIIHGVLSRTIIYNYTHLHTSGPHTRIEFKFTNTLTHIHIHVTNVYIVLYIV